MSKINCYEKTEYLVDRFGRPRHRLICTKAHGPIPPKWHVHHIDGDKRNNKPENLIALPPRVHSFIHEHYEPNELPRREICSDLIGKSKWYFKSEKRKKERKKEKERLIKTERKLKRRKINRHAPEVRNYRKAHTLEEWLSENEVTKFD